MDAIDANGFPSLVHRVDRVPSVAVAARYPRVSETTPGFLERKFVNQTPGSTLSLTSQPELEHNGAASDGAPRGTPEDLADRKAAVSLAFVGVAGTVVLDPIAFGAFPSPGVAG